MGRRSISVSMFTAAALVACAPATRSHRRATLTPIAARPARVSDSPARPLPAAELGAHRAPPRALSDDELRARLPGAARIDADVMLARRPVRFSAISPRSLERSPGGATILRGPFAPNDRERAALESRGFVLAQRRRPPSFLWGYTMAYLRDQPVYLTADAVLSALHDSSDALLAAIERDALHPRITRVMTRVQQQIRSRNDLHPEARADLDIYVAAALSALSGAVVWPVANGDRATVAELHTQIQAGDRAVLLRPFGRTRLVDFSQMRPRGHYTLAPELERYFRAMMWLGREGPRLIDVHGGRRSLDRRGMRAAMALAELLDEPASREALSAIDETLTQLVGEPEALELRDLQQLSRRVRSQGGLDALSDAQITAMIDEARGVRPRVATAMMAHPEGMSGAAPQPVAFAVVAQRYTPDAQVLTMVSFDRVDQGRSLRMTPSALDVGFAALGNDHAVQLAGDALLQHGYATELEAARVLIDAHEEPFWRGSLYASYLRALRALSPRETLAQPESLPDVMRTEAWSRRLLQTQLAAWAELRHDTVLYGAQSATMQIGCSYPSAYVDPYPALWAGLSAWSERARALIERTPWSTPEARARWTRWAQGARESTARLARIAERERAGAAMSAEDLAWINDALRARELGGCTLTVRLDGGWLYELYEPRRLIDELRMVVADVHTAPSDERGATGSVLHVGTSEPMTMVVFAGPPGREQAYVGFTYGYAERVTTGFDRLTDERWRDEQDLAVIPPWLRAVIVEEPAR